jgi:flagellar basal body-associated protein FliL
MYYQGEVEKNDRRKIITVATAIVVVVLILIVAIIVVATRKSSGNVAVTDGDSTTIEAPKAEPKEEPKEEPKAPVETVTVSAQPTTTTKAVVDTGPEDGLMMAAAFGSLTTAGTAYALSFSSRKKA